MSEQFELKRISPDNIARALEKADRYRLLNEPEEAESICRDVLAVEPENQRALVIIVLSMADQFANSHTGPNRKELRAFLSGLTDAYQSAYYKGICSEREARAMLARGKASAFAYDYFREAMHWYDQAQELSQADDDDAILRWNSCARTIMREKLRPRPDDERELPGD